MVVKQVCHSLMKYMDKWVAYIKKICGSWFSHHLSDLFNTTRKSVWFSLFPQINNKWLDVDGDS